MRRHFHSVAIASHGFQPSTVDANQPLIVYANHPSWWDPLIAHYVNHVVFKPRQFYAPIDAAALNQYKVFMKLGFYGVNLASHSGSAAFLRQSMNILHHPATSLFITPEGRFSDCRDHSAGLMPGLAHLCTKLQAGAVLPMALEYVFWEERLPECLVRFGEPFDIQQHPRITKPAWTAMLDSGLRQTQAALAEDSIARDSNAFLPVLYGRAGAGGIYESMRRFRSMVRGETFRPEHGDKLR